MTLTLIIAGLGVVRPAHAAQVPQALSLSGQLFGADGLAITATNVDFTVEILDAAATCVLYRERHLGEDLGPALGRFNLILGQGTTKLNNLDGSASFNATVLNNAGTVAVANCAQPTVSLNPGDARQVRLTYDLGSGAVALTPNVPLVSAGYALMAETVQGKGAADLIQVTNDTSTALTQANGEYAFSAVNWPRLKALLDGNSTQYLGTTPTMPIDLNGQRLVNLADPTAAQNASTKNYADTFVAGKPVDVSAVGPMTGNGSVLRWDATANTWVASFINTSATGTAGGDLQGTYPNPTIKDDAVTARKIASGGGGVSRLLITDASTGANVGYGACALNEVYAWSASGWACTAVATLAPVTKVAGRTGNVTLTAADIGSLGTAATQDYGTAATQLLRLDASARVPAVDGSLLTNVNATQLQTRAVAATAPVMGQVLGWNVSLLQWEPTTPVASSTGTVTNVASGTGLLGGPITATGTLSVDVGSAANKIVQENGGAQIAQLLGSAATPAYTFTGNLDTGLLSPGAGQVALSASGTARLSILANGFVGIGNTSPQNALDVIAPVNGQIASFASSVGAASVAISSAPANSSNLLLRKTSLNGGRWSVKANTTIEAGANVGSDFQIEGLSDTGTSLGTYLTITRANGSFGIMTAAPLAGLDVASTGTIASAIIVPRDSTAMRPTNAINGMLRYNSATSKFEAFENNAWTNLIGGAQPSFPLLANPNGSAATPAYSFNGNPNTGLYSPGAGQVALSANGTAALSVLASGSVGVGTTTPAAALEVVSSGTAANLIVRNITNDGFVSLRDYSGGEQMSLSAGGGNGNISVAGGTLTFGSRYPLSGYQFNSAGTPLMTLTNAARLGLGTTTPTVPLSFGNGTGVQTKVAIWDGGGGSSGVMGFGSNNGEFRMLYPAGGNNHISIGTWDNTTFTEKVRVEQSGNVGVGTTTPAAGLDVASTGTIASALIVPRDTTAMRPTVAINGMLRYNSATSKFEAFENNAWTNLIGGAQPSFPLLANPIGTAGVPAYSFSGNANTGVYSPGAGQLAISTNGTAALTFAANGDAVFNSTSASGNGSSGAVRVAGGLGVAGQISSNNGLLGPKITAYGGYNSAYTASSTGVGIPYSINLNATNAQTLDGALAAVNLTTLNGAAVSQTAYIGAVANASGTTPTIVIGQQSGASAYQERLRIDAGGNVGIGTTLPAQALSVAGTIESTTGGVKYPDGTTQTSAANSNWSFATKSANYTVLVSDKNTIFSISGATTVTLPSAASAGASFRVKILTTDETQNIVAFNGTDQVNGAVMQRIYLTASNALVTLISTGSAWLSSDYAGAVTFNCLHGSASFGSGSASYTLPSTACSSVTIKAWGAGGGAGGVDGGSAGGTGGGGANATVTTTIAPGTVLTVNSGGGGGLGSSAVTGIGGGSGGTSGGGAGGNAGSSGTSGAGGGGGGFTQVLNGATSLVIAAGGGGGGGGGGSPGGAGGGGNVAGTNAGGTGGAIGASGTSTGVAGQTASTDVGGGGGGGGGTLGGGGGTVGAAGGAGGGGGSSTGTIITPGAGTSPGNSSDANRPNNAGNGGAVGAVGSAGGVYFSF